jgi:hypothetical protein
MDHSPRPDATDPVQAVFAQLRDVAPTADVRDRHLTAMLAEVRAAGGALAADGDRGLGWWGRRARTTLGLTGVKLLVAATAAAATTGGGLAATGNLPDPVQQVVADAGERIGLRFPVPVGDDDEDSQGEDLAPAGDDVPSGEVPGSTPPGRGNGTGPDGQGAPAHGRPTEGEYPSERGRGSGRAPALEDAGGDDAADDQANSPARGQVDDRGAGSGGRDDDGPDTPADTPDQPADGPDDDADGGTDDGGGDRQPRRGGRGQDR